MQKLLIILPATLIWFIPVTADAIQMHYGAEGIIVHQAGHVFFLISMLILVFSIKGKGLSHQRGWRFIQYSALTFVLWNLNTISAHFLDNQIRAVQVEDISFWDITITSWCNSPHLAFLYYLLKFDHLLCVPAILLFYFGVSHILKESKEIYLDEVNR